MLFFTLVDLLVVLSFFTHYASSLAFANSNAVSSNTPKTVIAHFMVGIVPNYGLSDWKQDMAYAQETGIDAFALNCAPTRVDYYTPNQLAFAYEAASQMGFKVFISFDFAYWNQGDTTEIVNFMNKYSTHPGQLMYNSSAVVSTFVGDQFDWGPVKTATKGKLFAVPNQIDPRGPSYLNTNFDGVFSWYAWPTTGGNAPTAARMSTFWDDIFINSLAGKPYMAPVSPWFSPHFANKNWVFVCEKLITDRWNQILAMQPPLLQIISWNDYGEGHYIAPWQPNHSDDGSSQWTLGFPHDGWRTIMKPYITAYKSGASTPTVLKDQLVYWYRPTPKNTVCTGDPVGPSDGYQLLADDVFVTTMLTSPATLIVTSGTNAPIAIDVPAGIVTSNLPMGVGGQFFYIKRNGVTIMSGIGGRVITDTCDFYNFNAYVGSMDSSNSIGPAPSASLIGSSMATISSSKTTSLLTTLNTATSASTTRSSSSLKTTSSSQTISVPKTTPTPSRTTTKTTTRSTTSLANSTTVKPTTKPSQTTTSASMTTNKPSPKTTKISTKGSSTQNMSTSNKGTTAAIVKTTSASPTPKVTKTTARTTSTSQKPATSKTTTKPAVQASTTLKKSTTTTRKTTTTAKKPVATVKKVATKPISTKKLTPTIIKTLTSTRKPSTTSESPRVTSATAASTVCYEGVGNGNYIGLCQFACSFGYCPPGPCSCTSFVPASKARTPPPDTGRRGFPLPYLDASYLGLCAFACARDYCPPTACY